MNDDIFKIDLTGLRVTAEDIYRLRKQGYKMARIRTKQGRTLYINLSDPSAEGWSEVQGGMVWGQISPDSEQGWNVFLMDIESIEGVKEE